MSYEKEAVLTYLEKVNRPYSVNDILQNLHKEYGKAAIQKALDQLVADMKIREKIYGKQKVYSILQQELNDTGGIQKELQQLEDQINKKTDDLKKIEEEMKTAISQLATFQSTLTTDEIQKQKTEFESEISNFEIKLALLSEDKIVVSEKDREKIKKLYEYAIKEYKKRKRICMDILNSILEGYPKTKKVLIEEIGIELDDENISFVLKT